MGQLISTPGGDSDHTLSDHEDEVMDDDEDGAQEWQPDGDAQSETSANVAHDIQTAPVRSMTLLVEDVLATTNFYQTVLNATDIDHDATLEQRSIMCLDDCTVRLVKASTPTELRAARESKSWLRFQIFVGDFDFCMRWLRDRDVEFVEGTFQSMTTRYIDGKEKVLRSLEFKCPAGITWELWEQCRWVDTSGAGDAEA